MAKMKSSMRLFGIPHQFRSSVDPRMSNLSTSIGRKFLQNIVLEEPVITIIPGKPQYLPGTKKSGKNTMTAALLTGASDNFSSIRSYLGKATQDEIRYYDFARSYTEYMKYVNILCRACATFLEIKETIDGVSMARYDWRNYRQNASSYSSTTSNVLAGIGASTSKKFLYATTNAQNGEDEVDSLEDMMANVNYIQFYVDPDVGAQESMSNNTMESKLKGIMDSGSDLLKEISFVGNSGGMNMEELQAFGDTSIQALSDFINGLGDGQVTTAISRILSVGSNVIKGENVIIPDIYQSSTYDKSYSFTVHLKTPYGNKFAYFLNVVVPLMHLIALVIPKQTTANTYGSPFLIKADVPGVFTCNMGIVSSLMVNKNVAPESWTVDGLPNEVDVTVNMIDLYSDLAMSPQSSPILFVNNSSLIDYLAVSCGLSILQPQLKKKIEFTMNTAGNAIADVPTNAVSLMTEYMDNEIANWVGLTW